ncbi:class I SAM-dependent methyltransferase [Patescibacteria group bacterium]|nr:class I SAM-dependent methyltransferase [Patescibacteria group bacterium]
MTLNSLLKRNRRITQFLLKKSIQLHNYSYHKISEYASALEKDLHPKHAIMDYHRFFVERVTSSDRVLDLGCGNGYLAYDVAEKAKQVVGIDIRPKNIEKAKARFQRPNLSFVVGDATIESFPERFDAIVLSNVLEHIEKRVEFLKKLKGISSKIIFRVPMINRDWTAMYKKLHGFEYRLDDTHFIEYTLETLLAELAEAGWKLDYYQINWGEIWGEMVAI